MLFFIILGLLWRWRAWSQWCHFTAPLLLLGLNPASPSIPLAGAGFLKVFHLVMYHMPWMLVNKLWVMSFSHHLQSGLCLNRVVIGAVLYYLSYVKARFVLLVMILGSLLMFNLKWVTWYIYSIRQAASRDGCLLIGATMCILTCCCTLWYRTCNTIVTGACWIFVGQ